MTQINMLYFRSMQMKVTIDFTKIINWDDFHSSFSNLMGFPDFYGKNMNAWIDCMSYIDDPDSGMSKIVVRPDEHLDIVVIGTEKAFKICPEIFKEFLECASFVNQRFIESNVRTRIKIIAI